MPESLLLVVTGPPGTGKTTLGRRLAHDLHLPFFNKDAIKERLFESLGWEDREWSKRLGRASIGILLYVVEAELIAGGSLVVESNFHPELADADFLALKARYGYRPLQLCLHCDGEVLLNRYHRRAEAGERHPGHVDRQTYEEVDAVLRRGRDEPLHLGGEVIELDTTDFGAVDYGEVLRTVRAHLPGAHAGRRSRRPSSRRIEADPAS